MNEFFSFWKSKIVSWELKKQFNWNLICEINVKFVFHEILTVYPSLCIDISRLNDYLNLLCITAYIIRFVNNLKQNVKKTEFEPSFSSTNWYWKCRIWMDKDSSKGISGIKSYFNQLKINFGVIFDNQNILHCGGGYNFPIFQKILKIQLYYRDSHICLMS